MRRLAVLGIVALFGAASVATTPRPVHARAEQVRDAGGPPPAGTAGIRGVVQTADSVPQPVRRAVVSISGATLGRARGAVTDDAGAFEIAGLPAGSVMASASKHGFTAGAFGASKPGRPGTPIVLVAGQVIDVSIRLARTAVATGVVRDANGEPLPDLLVFALGARNPNVDVLVRTTGQTARSAPMATTDDRGVYRLFDLAPGAYFIVAVAKIANQVISVSEPSVSDVDAQLAALARRQEPRATSPQAAAPRPAPQRVLAPAYFPGTPRGSQATAVTLGAGEERRGLDFVLTTVPLASIEGRVTSTVGELPPVVELYADGEEILPAIGLASPSAQTKDGPDRTGAFRVRNLPPGHYTLSVRGSANGSQRMNADSPGAVLYGHTEVDVDGDDVKGIVIPMTPGVQVGARIVFEGPATPPASFGTLRVALLTVIGGGSWVSGTSMPAIPSADGTVDFGKLAPGSYRIAFTGAIDAHWWPRSAMTSGRDVLDVPLEIGVGGPDIAVTLTFSARHSVLSGALATPGGSVTEYSIIAFSTDRTLWLPEARRVRSTRPASDGSYSFADLPAGDYRLAAVTDLEPREWQTPAFLTQLVPGSVQVTVGDGAGTVQNLKIER